MLNPELILSFRHIIDDLDEDAPTYSDRRIQELLMVAGQMVIADADFTTDYSIDVDELIFTPDPTDRDLGRDEAFIQLVLLKAACLLHKSVLRQAAGRAIDVKDGNVAISFKGEYTGRTDIAKNACKEYADTLYAYQIGQFVPSRVILGPMSSDRVMTYRSHSDLDRR